MKDVIKSIRKSDPAMKRSPEVLLYPGFWAVLFHRLAHRLYRLRFFFIARFISQLSRFLTGIEIHPGAVVGKGLFIDHGAGVVIGETSEIGDNVIMYQGVTLGGTGKEKGKRHPTIGNNVFIGAGATILGPFNVGDNSRIGAGSVVLREVPANCTVVGVPARVVVRHDNKTSVDRLDQVRLPDPVTTEICALRAKIEQLEAKMEKMKKQGEITK